MNELDSENQKLTKENEELKEDNILLIEDSEKYRKLSIQFDNRNKELISENEQFKQQIKDMKIRFKREYDHEFDEIVDELW